MKTRISLLLFLILFSVFALQAQQTEIRNRSLSVHNIYFNAGVFPTPSGAFGLEAFRVLAPSSAILQDDFNGYRSWIFFSGMPATELGVSAGFGRGSRDNVKKHSAPEFRAGFYYGSSNVLLTGFEKSDRVTVDSLYSARTGAMYQVDSVSYNYVTVEHLRKYLKGDFSLIFRSGYLLGLSLFGGVGMNMGYSIENKLRVRSVSSNRLESVSPFNGREILSFHSPETIEELVPVAGSFSFTLYIPAGIDMRLSSQSELLGRVHFYYEVRLGYAYQSMAPLGGISQTAVQHLIGLRIAMD